MLTSGLAHRPSPKRNSFRFSLPSSGLSFRVPSAWSPLRAFTLRSYLLGSVPSSRHHRVTPNNAERSTALLAPSPVFSTVRRLLLRSLRACFIPQPSPGLSLVQGLIHPVQPSAFSDWLRPCRSTRARSPASRLPRSRASTPTFCSTRSRSPPVWCLASPAVCSPLRVSCSSRFTWCQRGQLPVLERSCRCCSAFSRDLRGGLVQMPRRSTSAHFRRQTWMPRLRSALPARAFGPSTLTCQKAKRAWLGSHAVD
jgi:hypothetical protein